MKTIARDDYLQQLIDRKHNGLVKIVTGIRRCGKSYLLFTLFKQHLLDSGVPEDHIIEIALDDRANKSLRDPDVCYQYVKNSIICQLSFNTPANAGHPSAEELSFLPINGSSPRMQGKLVVMQ